MERFDYKSETAKNDDMHIDQSLVNRDLKAADVIRKQLTNQSTTPRTSQLRNWHLKCPDERPDDLNVKLNT